MNIYVGNLPWSIENDELARIFGEFGEVKSARVIKDKFTGKSRGFGFVEMATENDADQAIAKLDNRELQGRTLRVSKAKNDKPFESGDVKK